MKNDLELPPEKRIAWMIQFKESYETMFDPDSDIEMEKKIIRGRVGRKKSSDTSSTTHEDNLSTITEPSSTKRNKYSLGKIHVFNEETQKLIFLDVHPYDTIKTVKKKIEDQANIPANIQCLLWKGNELQDGDKLSEHNIEGDSLLVLKELFVKVSILIEKTQKLTSLDVHPHDTIKTIKKKIEDQANIPADIQCLMWKDDELQDSKKLLEYDLEEDSFLILKQCISL